MNLQALSYWLPDLLFQSGLDNQPMDTIGTRVKALRQLRHMTQVQLAQKSKIAQPTISNIENAGPTYEIDAKTLLALAKALATTPEYLFNGAMDEDHLEEVMQEAELQAIFRELPRPAKESLILAARTVRQAVPAATPAHPFANGAPPKPPKKSKLKS